MSDFSEKYKKYELKKKKTNRDGIILLLAGLAIFATLFIYYIDAGKEKQKDAEILFQYNIEQIKENEIHDSIKYMSEIKLKDSIKQVLQQVQTEIDEIKNEEGINKTVRQKIDFLQGKLNTIKSIAQDTIIVRYYKRSADDNNVENAIKSITNPNFNLHYRNVPNDNDRLKVNALYYGKNVNENYVKLLHKRLRDNKVNIKYIKPFVSARGFEWKQNAMEIGYEKTTSKTDENARLYARIYSFKPNIKIKYAIRNKLEAKGFQVKVYPDWREKPSFFSNESTVLYYHISNKEKAISIAKTLTELTRRARAVTEFKVKKEAGYGISDNERKELFIVHYNGIE